VGVVLVREVMTTSVVTVREDTPIKSAIRLLEEHDITGMPVVDDDGHLVGVVTEADVIRESVLPDQRAHEVPVRLSSAPLPGTVGDVMSTRPLVVSGDTELAEAVDLMTSSVVKSLPVVDRGRLVGVVSRRDVVGMLAREDGRIEADIDAVLRDLGRDLMITVEEGVVTVEGVADDREARLVEALAATVPGVMGVRTST
jgi:CBS domain-containing protein